jgi:regulator of chromosome condensation
VPNFNNPASLCCGSNHNLAVNQDGRLFAWGFAEMYQLGNGRDEDVQVPTHIATKSIKDVTFHNVSAGGQHSLMLGSKLTHSSQGLATSSHNT